MRNIFILIISISSFYSFSSEVKPSNSTIQWQELTTKTFDQAKKENKIILLNLEANWCHWCHVMYDSTYSNTEVLAYINQHFITVKADQDANPELSNRYKNWGWPATVFINSDGDDVVKRAGYINPRAFLRLLKAIVADPSPEVALDNLSNVKSTRTENSALQKELIGNFGNSLDYKRGGFNQAQKYVEYATFEYALFASQNESVKNWTKISIEGAKKLSDPEWGGIYQYSTHNDWEHLHFEKLLSVQARYTNLFLLNYYYNNDPVCLEYAKKTVAYADRFLLKSNGLYSNAQDADLVQGQHSESYFNLSDSERLKLGIPKVDTNTFTDNNAAMAISLVKLYNATSEKRFINQANKIVEQLLKRKNEYGFYKHAYESRGIASLRDQIAVSELFIELLKNDANNQLIKSQLKALLELIRTNFINENGSLKSFSGSNGLSPEPIIEENIRMARVFNWFSASSNDLSFKEIAKNVYHFLISDEVSKDYYSEPALLMLERELQDESTNYVFLQTDSGNDFSGALHVVVPFYSIVYTGELNSLPKDKQGLIAGFNENVLLMCTSSYCSSPIYDLGSLMKKLK